MNSAPTLVETSQVAAAPSETVQERSLPSGRSVVVRVTGAGEELQVRSPAGEVEVHITLGVDGPVVRLRSARLELETPDTIALQCRRLEINAADHLQLQSGGDLRLSAQEMRAETRGDIHMNGDVIRLNC